MLGEAGQTKRTEKTKIFVSNTRGRGGNIRREGGRDEDLSVRSGKSQAFR